MIARSHTNKDGNAAPLAILVRLASHPAHQAVVKVHPSFSWNVLMEAISACLRLDEDSMIQWLVLVESKGRPLSSSITSIGRFHKMCETWGSTVTTELLTFEVHLADPNEEISLDSRSSKASDVSTSKSSRVVAPDLGAAARIKLTAAATVGKTSQDIRHEQQQLLCKRVLVRVKLRCDTSCTGEANIIIGSSWETVVENVITALCLDPTCAILHLTLIDADEDRISAPICTTEEFWKVVDKT